MAASDGCIAPSPLPLGLRYTVLQRAARHRARDERMT